jgi:hypothetical protein
MALYPTGTGHDIAGRNLVSQPRFTYTVTDPQRDPATGSAPAHFFDWWAGKGTDPLNINGPRGEANGLGSAAVGEPVMDPALKYYTVATGAAPWGFMRIRLGDADNPVGPGTRLQLWLHYKAPGGALKISVDWVGGAAGFSTTIPASANWKWAEVTLPLPYNPGGTIAPADANRPVLTLATISTRGWKLGLTRVDYEHPGVVGYFDGDTPAHLAGPSSAATPEQVTFGWVGTVGGGLPPRTGPLYRM